MTIHNVPLSMATFDGVVNGVAAGDVVKVAAGYRNQLTLKKITGAAGNHVAIINEGGIVTIDTSQGGGTSFCLVLDDCEYVTLSGRGYKNGYGFRVYKYNTSGVEMRNGTHHCILEGCEIGPSLSATKGNGIHWGARFGDTGTWTGEDIVIRHNYIHDTGTEGMYIGIGSTAGAPDADQAGQPFDGMQIYDNLLEDCGWDGIQVRHGSNVLMYGNRIHSIGEGSSDVVVFAAAGGVGSGIVISSEISDADIFSNIVDTASIGIYVLDSVSGIRVFRNLIKTIASSGGLGGFGIRVSGDSGGLQLYENTIHEYDVNGIKTKTGDTGTGSERCDSNVCASDEGGVTHIDCDYTNKSNNEVGTVATLDFETHYFDTLGDSSPALSAGVGGIHCGWKQAIW